MLRFPNRGGITKAGDNSLRAALDALERDWAAGISLTPSRLSSLRSRVLDSVRLRDQLGPLRRYLKTLTVISDGRDARLLLEEAFKLQPQSNAIALLLSDALAAENEHARALEIIEPFLGRKNTDVTTLVRAAKLYGRLGKTEKELSLLNEAVARDPERLATYLHALITAGRREEARAKARNVLAENSSDPRVAHACYAALWRLREDPSELASVRSLVIEHAGEGSVGHLWRARLYQLEGNTDAACMEIDAGLADAPDDPALTKERCRYALASGYWGRDAGILLKAWQFEPPFSERFQAIAQAEEMLRAFGGSLEAAAQEPHKFAHVKTPETVFDYVVGNLESVPNADGRSGLVMIIGSLAAGGAERVVANLFRLLSEGSDFAWTKLYVCELTSEMAKDFYLSLTGSARDRVAELSEPYKPERPISWLHPDYAEPAQRILDRLRRDRPAAVHASLEPLTIVAGLSALIAGVPRIVLHTHNMRPASVGMGDAERMRDCYRALLSRPEVSLVCCAHACANDYAEWLGSDYRSKIHVVHNGIDERSFSRSDLSVLRNKQRIAHGVDPAAPVIGTAFRFADVKQPLLWVDAAQRILAQWPGCRFVMFGDGELWNRAQQNIAQKGLSDCFILPGRVSDLLDRLAMLDLFMLSSSSEALPNVLLEAQSAGVPVVAFDVGGISEAMITGVTGRLAGELSASELADVALQVLCDRAWMSRAVHAGPLFVSEQFSMQKMVKQLSTILLHDQSQPSEEKSE